MTYVPNEIKCKDCGTVVPTREMTPRRALLRLCDPCWNARTRLVKARESGAVTAEQFEVCQKALARHNGKGRLCIEQFLKQAEATDE